MPRLPRQIPGGYVYHVINRAAARSTLFHKDGDYRAWLRLLDEALAEHPIRLLAYCLMPNHWHMVLWPETDDQVTSFLHWLTLTHAVRWRTHYHNVGVGHVYQGRFKAFPVQTDNHLYTLLRYVERNALRADLVARAENWSWGSLALRQYHPVLAAQRLAVWPSPLPGDWLTQVNEPQTEEDLALVRQAVSRNCPFGDDAWRQAVAQTLGLEATLRPRGRPRKEKPTTSSSQPIMWNS